MARTLNVLIACEESGRVRDAFRELGHNAWSCDMQPCDPASPYRDYHLKGNLLHFFDRNYSTFDGVDWSQCFKPKNIDLMIAHPPCTYLCNSGVCWLEQGRNVDRMKLMRQGASFFCEIWNQHEIPCIAIENPIMHKYARWELQRHIPTVSSRPTQIIQPYMFGHLESKATCLWLKGLPKLAYNEAATKANKAVMKSLPPNQRNRLHYLSPGPQRAKERSRTYPGIALAMATQWSEYVLEHY